MPGKRDAGQRRDCASRLERRREGPRVLLRSRFLGGFKAAGRQILGRGAGLGRVQPNAKETRHACLVPPCNRCRSPDREPGRRFHIGSRLADHQLGPLVGHAHASATSGMAVGSANRSRHHRHGRPCPAGDGMRRQPIIDRSGRPIECRKVTDLSAARLRPLYALAGRAELPRPIQRQ